MHDGSEQERGDSVEIFLGDLRELRDRLDPPPTWDAMVSRAKNRRIRVGKSTLHKVAKNNTLPSELAVRGYVASLGGTEAEIDQWVARRTALAEPRTAELVDVGVGPAAEGRPSRLPGGLGWWWAVLAAVVVGTNVVTGVVVYRISSPQPQQTSAPASTGDNPVNTICVDDAKIAATTTKNPQFLLEIVFSAKCRAFWAKITRADERALGNHIEVSLYRRSDPQGSTRQDAVEPDVKSGFTTMIVRTDPTDRVCATGAVVTDEIRAEAAEPICI